MIFFGLNDLQFVKKEEVIFCLPNVTNTDGVKIAVYDIYDNVIFGKNYDKILNKIEYKVNNLSPDSIYCAVVAFYLKGVLIKEYKASFYIVNEKAEFNWISIKKNSCTMLQFKKEFYIKKKIKSVVLYICGLGFFDSYINGLKTDKYYFKPLVTDYEYRDIKLNSDIPIGKKRRFCPIVLDVTQLINAGHNVLSVNVGNGYYENTDRPEEPYFSYGEKKIYGKRKNR